MKRNRKLPLLFVVLMQVHGLGQFQTKSMNTWIWLRSEFQIQEVMLELETLAECAWSTVAFSLLGLKACEFSLFATM